MSIYFSLSVEGDLLHVTTTGQDDGPEDVRQYAINVALACLQHNCKRMLVDERKLTYRLGTLDTFDLARFGASNAPYTFKIAVVSSTEGWDDASFWADAARNRGLNCKSFISMDEARAWLDPPG